MKRLRRIVATDENYNTDIRFTPDGICELLSGIEELKNCEIDTMSYSDGSVEFIIGDTAYLMKN